MLHNAVTGIGQPDSGITFMKSDFNRDFYTAVGVLHGCVMIVNRNPELIKLRNAFAFGFIAPRTWTVYRTWQECEFGT
jgi:hypothetical protein